MPLDFTNPRAKPTLGRRRTAKEVEEALRDHPKESIVSGLREQGGRWTQRDPEEQRRIDRLKSQITDDSADRFVNSPEKWAYLTREELVDATDTILRVGSRAWTRPVEPCKVEVFHDPATMSHRLTLTTSEGESIAQRITREEMQRYETNAVDVVDTCFGSMYRQLVEREAATRTKERLRKAIIKPIEH